MNDVMNDTITRVMESYRNALKGLDRTAPMIAMGRSRIKKEDREKFVKLQATGYRRLDWRRFHPASCTQNRSRYFFKPYDEDTEEIFYIDEYDSVEDFELMQKAMMNFWKNQSHKSLSSEAEEHQKLGEEISSLSIPGTQEILFFNEIEQLRIQFEPWKVRAAALPNPAPEDLIR